MNNEKQIWFSKKNHQTIKVAAAKQGISMRGYIMNLVKNDK